MLRVSRIAQELYEKVKEFRSKPIEQEITYLFVDATYFKIRDNVRYTNKVLFVVAGVRKEGLTRSLRYWTGPISRLLTTRHFQKSIGEK